MDMTNDAVAAEMAADISVRRVLRELTARWLPGSAIVIGAMVIALIVSYFIPVTYRANALLAPVSEQMLPRSLGGAAGSLGALAMLGGLNLGESEVSQTDLLMATLKARQFALQFMQRHDIAEVVLGARWHVLAQQSRPDPDIYDAASGKWVADVDGDGVVGPNADTVYEAYRHLVKIELDRKTGLLQLGVVWRDRERAEQWLRALTADLNNDMREREVDEAQRSLAFLEKQLKMTEVTAIQELLYKLSEEKLKTIMLANVRTEYALKTVDPPASQLKRNAPRRTLLILSAALVGLIGMTAWVVVRV